MNKGTCYYGNRKAGLQELLNGKRTFALSACPDVNSDSSICVLSCWMRKTGSDMLDKRLDLELRSRRRDMELQVAAECVQK